MKRSLKLVTVLSIAAALTMAGCQASTPQPAAPQPTTAPAAAPAQPTTAQPAAAQPAAAQPTAAPKPAAPAFPTKPIDLVVTYGPGSGAGVISEYVNKIITDQKLSPQPFVISYKPGASGQIGAALVSARKGDPYALFQGGASLSVMYTLGQSPLNPVEDFTPLGLVAMDYSVVFTSANSPYKTYADVVNALKKSPKSISLGGTGLASWDGLLAILMESTAGVKFNTIPFNSGAEVNAAVLGGQVDMATGNIPEMEPLVEAGKLRALAMVGDQRFPGVLKDVPTLKELGYDVAWGMPRGWMAAPGIPKESVQWYGDLFKKISDSPAWDDFTNKNMMVRKYMTPDDFRKYTADLMTAMTAAFKQAGAIK